jgi:hypothetical protein
MYMYMREAKYKLTTLNGTEINGATDHVLKDYSTSDFVVATIESKGSSKDLTGVSFKAQFLAELSAEYNKIVDKSLVKPSEMCGVMTNGSDWMLARLFYREGKRKLHYAYVNRKDTDATGKVARFLLHLLDASLKISSLLNTKVSSKFIKPNEGMVSGEDGDGDGDGDGGNNDDDADDDDEDKDKDSNNHLGKEAQVSSYHYSMCYGNEFDFVAPLSMENLRKHTLNMV